MVSKSKAAGRTGGRTPQTGARPRRGLLLVGLLVSLCTQAAAQQAGRVYVADEGANALRVIDPASNAVSATIPLAGTPGIAAVSPAGDRLFVPLRGANQIAVVETATNSVIATISHASLSEPTAVAFFAGRSEVWAVNRTGGPGGNGSVTVIDANTLAFNRTVTSASFSAPEHIAFSPVGAQVYVVNTGNGTLTQILASDYTVNFSVPVGATPRFAVVGQVGRFIYVSNEGSANFSIVDMFTLGVQFVPTPGNPRNMTLGPGGSRLYIALQNNLVSVFDIQTQLLRNVSFPTPGFVSHAVAIQAGTPFGYVSNRGAATVALFDTTTLMPVDGDGDPVSGLSAPRALLSIGVVEVSDLTLNLTGAPASALGGEPVTYSVEVSNGGPSTATDTRLTFDLSAPYTLISAAAGQGSCQVEDETDTVVCQLGVLDFGDTVPVSIQLAILASGSVNATFAVESEETDPNTADNTVVASTSVTAAADIQVTITDQPDPVQVGSLLVYTVRILNRGPSTAVAVRFFDPLPFGVLLDSVDAGLGNCLASDASVLCNLESILSGQEQIVVIRVIPTMAGTLLNGVDVRSDVVDPNPSNNAAVALTMVRGGIADMVLVKESLSPLVNPGVNFLYRFVATNEGPDAAARVRVTDVAPAGLEFFPEGGEPGCEFEAGTLTCRVDRLGAGESQAFTVAARIDAAVGETFSNTASVAASDTDPNPGNNSATASVRVVARGDLNGDGVLDARDVQELVLEINDGDGDAAADAAGGSHPGNATMDVNGDGLINRDDLRALVDLIFR